ncbi:MAG: hypothetical protein PHF86_05120 [Candidatus Nanoarchaeia archaeon]|jgi:hypothetical protein|nr:hypothetical protein [Candidatus Nanoarchaeia archaeon]
METFSDNGLIVSRKDNVTTLSSETDSSFTKKIKTKIYMPDEYTRAYNEVLSGEDVIVLGMNGFSTITPERCSEWGIQFGAYEAACEFLLSHAIEKLQHYFRGISIRLANGASDIGVDLAINNTAKKFGLPLLGHSCPKYLKYVREDIDIPIYVAQNQERYSNAFTDSLDILITANGGEVTFKADIDAAFNKAKHVIPIDILSSISTTGGPPAFDKNGKVLDAVKAFNERVHIIAMQINNAGADQWETIVDNCEKIITSISRKKLSAKRAFRI